MKPFMRNYPSGCVARNSSSFGRKTKSTPSLPPLSLKKKFSWPGGYISTVAKVKNVDWEKRKPMRAGIIVYNYYQGKLLFCMGVDRKTKELTDFGGGVSYKFDKSALRGAIREFTEESLGVFGEIKEEDLQECVVVYTHSMAIVFLPLAAPPSDVTSLFVQRYRREKVGEVSALAWMNLRTFLDTLYKRKKEGRFYVRVEKLLSPVIYKVLQAI